MRRGTSKHERQQVRRGDWICLVCHNHNFSFRKFCNRCENQSRRDNEVQTNMIRRRIDMQMTLELQASYNTFPKALFLVLREEYPKQEGKIQRKIESGSSTEEDEAQDCNWVATVLDETEESKLYRQRRVLAASAQC